MAAMLSLPSDKDLLAEAVGQMVKDGESVRNARAVQWWITHFYLEGCRQFTLLDYINGTVRASESNDGEGIPFKLEEAVKRYQMEVGRLLRIDTSPQVKRRGNTLDSLRDASVGQATLSSIVSPSDVNKTKLELMPMLAKYGMGGVLAWVPPNIKEEATALPAIETVPPWELLPVPANPASHSEVRGTIRSRWVTLDWLESHADYKKSIDKSKDSDLEVREVEVGRAPAGSRHSPHGAYSQAGGAAASDSIFPRHPRADDIEAEMPLTKYVRFNELWVQGDRGRLARYVVTAGRVLLLDEDYTKPESPSPMMPIGIARYVDTGTFYGRGFVELMIPANVQAETFIQNLFDNANDLDLLGFIAIPTTLGFSVTELVEGSARPRVIQYEPDPMRPALEPKLIQPATTGMLPARVAELALSLIERMSPQGPMSVGQAPGRVDSAQGLGIVREEAATPLVLPAASIAEAYASVYRAILGYARETWSSITLGSIATIDDAIAGVVIDPRTGTLDREKNAAPDPLRVDVGIVSSIPQSPEQIKEDLVFAVKMGGLSPVWFRIEARRRGLDLPLGSDADWHTYRMAMLNNILVFGDGQTPGEAVVSAYMNHGLALEIVAAFMARPEYNLASIEVREKFEKLRQEHEEMLGQKYPESLPYPEDAPNTAAPSTGGGQVPEELLAMMGGGGP